MCLFDRSPVFFMHHRWLFILYSDEVIVNSSFFIPFLHSTEAIVNGWFCIPHGWLFILHSDEVIINSQIFIPSGWLYFAHFIWSMLMVDFLYPMTYFYLAQWCSHCKWLIFYTHLHSAEVIVNGWFCIPHGWILPFTVMSSL